MISHDERIAYIRHLIAEGRKTRMSGEDPCWDGYQMVGTKKGAGGKEVPNCVPEEVEHEIERKEQIDEMNPMLVRDGLQVIIDFLSQYPTATALTAGAVGAAAGTAIISKLVKDAWKNHKELEQIKQDVVKWSSQKLHANKNASARGGKVAKIIQAEIERRKSDKVANKGVREEANTQHPYHAGYDAYGKKKTRQHNPYKEGSEGAAQWAKGWEHASDGKPRVKFTNEEVELDERELTTAELKKREQIAQAIERKNPRMDMSKKMAIATATAKRVA